MTNNNNRLKIIKNFAVEADWNNAFDGKTKGNRHLFRVAKIAKFLAKQEKANIFIAEAGALLHDITLSLGYDDYDYNLNKKVCLKELKKLPLEQDEIIQIVECIASHEGTTQPKTLEAQIVHDADVLEKAGLLGIIRHTWKLTSTNLIDPEKIKKEDIEKIVNHVKWRAQQVKNPFAKKISVFLNKNINLRIASLIVKNASPLVVKGLITEKIAKTLYLKMNEKEVESLKSQLDTSYLNMIPIDNKNRLC